jgi:hypothetical protein
VGALPPGTLKMPPPPAVLPHTLRTPPPTAFKNLTLKTAPPRPVTKAPDPIPPTGPIPAPPPGLFEPLTPIEDDEDSVRTVAVASPIHAIAMDAMQTITGSLDIVLEAEAKPAPPAPHPSVTNPPPSQLPQATLTMKPASSPLAPSRAPAPMAIVGGGSLRINADAPPSRPSRPTPSRPATNEAFSPQAPPSSAKHTKAPSLVPSSRPDANRPETSPKSFPPPAGGPPVQYERAFRQWSSPAITTEDPAAGQVTFQVYTPQDLGRGPMRSLPAIASPPAKSSLAVRVGLALVGGVVVLLTAAAVIAVSTEEPKHTAPTTPVTAAPVPTETATATAEPAPAPTTVIGDPIDEPPPVATTAKPKRPAPTQPAAPVQKASPTSTTPATPASLKALAPPPNPYGK